MMKVNKYFLTNNLSLITKIKRAISEMNKHIKQYANNHGITYKPLNVVDLNKVGLIEQFIKLTSLNSDLDLNFILLHRHIGWKLNNIIVGNRKIREELLLKLDIKYCGTCCKFHNKSEFKGDNSKYDKLNSTCKTCDINHRRTKYGLIRRMYNRQRHSSIERGHPPPEYSREWLYEKLMSDDNFHKMFNTWVNEGYNKNYTPSIDRINFLLPYTKSNIQLLT